MVGTHAMTQMWQMLEEEIGRRHTHTEVFSLISSRVKKHSLATDIIVEEDRYQLSEASRRMTGL